jgi:serine protease Do
MLRAYSLLLLVIFYASAAHAEQAGSIDPAASVYKVRVKRNSHVADGSAVLVAPGRLLTACHVIRSAQSIRVGREEMQWQAYPATGDIKHDLCILDVPELAAAVPAAIGETERLGLGDAVIAVGYPRGGKRDTTYGQVKGLHALDGADVLQVSTQFDRGTSGGGLFDGSGRLIGIIGFKAMAGGNFNFALPLAWAGDAVPGQRAITADQPQAEQAFWERPNAERPLFLRAASLEANRQWEGLKSVAEEWVATDELNPASWLCLSRTLKKLNYDQAATLAFAHAESLMPSLQQTQNSSVAR